jgi:hypothetical protein
MMKRKILERINQVDEKELAKIMKETQDNNNGAAAAESVKAQTINNDVDRASIITQDRLKKFNEINGYENGPATEELEQEEDEIQDE